MHFDGVLSSVGFGVAQWMTLFCCGLITFVEGFLPAGIFYFMPQFVCNAGRLPLSYLVSGYIPYVSGLCVGSILTCSDVCERRSMLGFSSVLCFCSTLFASSATIIHVYEIAIFVAGLGVAGISSGTRILFFETLPFKARGKCMPLLDVITSSGVLSAIVWSHYSGSYVNSSMDVDEFSLLKPTWRVHLIICAMLSLVGAITVGLSAFSPRQKHAHKNTRAVKITLRRFYAVNNKEHESLFHENVNFPPEPFHYSEGISYQRAFGTTQILFVIKSTMRYLLEIFKYPFTFGPIALIIINFCLSDGSIVMMALISNRVIQGPEQLITLGRVVNLNNSNIMSTNAEVCADSKLLYINIIHIYMAAAAIFTTAMLPFLMDLCLRPVIVAISCIVMPLCSLVLAFGWNYAADLTAGLVLAMAYTAALSTLKLMTLEHFPTKFRATAYGVTKMASRLSLAALFFIQDAPNFIMFIYAMTLPSITMIVLLINNTSIWPLMKE